MSNNILFSCIIVVFSVVIINKIEVTAFGFNGQGDSPVLIKEENHVHKEELRIKRNIDQCVGNKCLKKCCKIGEHIIKQKKCGKPTKTYGNLDFSDVPIYTGNREKTGKSLKDVYVHMEMGALTNKSFKGSVLDYAKSLKNNYRFYLTENSLTVEVLDNDHRWYVLSYEKFCVDYQMPEKNMTAPEPRFLIDITLVRNSDSRDDTTRDSLITYGLIISCVFLTLVLIVYSLLPELRNICGLVLMGYVASLLGAFALLFTLRLEGLSKTNTTCQALTSFTYFFLMASFCWTNVMSVDIWWTFRGYAKARPIHRRGEHFKFLMYSVYAWGVPLIMTIILLVINNIDPADTSFTRPNFGRNNCFLDDKPKMYYLYAPMIVLLSANWVLYLMAVFNIRRLHRCTTVLDTETNGTPAAHRRQTSRLLVYLKLSVLMGINWILEVVSYKLPGVKELWYITDTWNVLIGLSIFIIFVCKRKIFAKLAKRYQGCKQSQRQRYKSRFSDSSVSSPSESEISADSRTAQVCADPKGPKPYQQR